VPEELYERLAKVAKAENRSIAQETIVLVRNALNLTSERMARRKEFLVELDEIDLGGTHEFPAPEKLIREDRDR
jgi:hypothetical protein